MLNNNQVETKGGRKEFSAGKKEKRFPMENPVQEWDTRSRGLFES